MSNQAVEPYTDEELEKVRALAFNENQYTADTPRMKRLLATIEADREKLEHAGEQFALLSASTGRALKDLLERAEAAEARVSELEKERDALQATVDGITQKALGDPRTSVSVKGVGSYVPTPPEEEAK